MTTQQLQQLDQQHLWHPFTPMKLWLADDPLVITAAEGMHLIDSDGRRYLDGVSSLWCNVHGHRVPEIDAAVRTQLDKVAHTTMLGLASEPAILLADRLMKIVPQNLKKIFYSDAGATATEIAFKLAAQYWYNIGKPEKCEFVGFAEAYHGDTFGAMSVGRTELFHRAYFPMLFKVHYTPTPFVYRPLPEMVKAEERVHTIKINRARMAAIQGRYALDPALRAEQVSWPSESSVLEWCLADLRNLLEKRHAQIAAICIEPIVQGAAGMIVHPEGFLRGVRELCTKYEVLLIADEVAVGFGRTGKMFACEHESVEPDLMCVAKGITGGYLPLAATFATQKIFDAFLGDPWEGKTFYHGHTYTGNPLACAAAMASLDLFEKNDLVATAQHRAKELAGLLSSFSELPCVGEIRQKGLMVGVELVADRATRTPFDSKRRIGAQVCTALRKHGVILRPLGDVIVLMPPLAMGMEDLTTIVRALHAELAVLTI